MMVLFKAGHGRFVGQMGEASLLSQKAPLAADMVLPWISGTLSLKATIVHAGAARTARGEATRPAMVEVFMIVLLVMVIKQLANE